MDVRGVSADLCLEQFQIDSGRQGDHHKGV
jgi:hypothetical protein